VAERHHKDLQERRDACTRRPCALQWMIPHCDSMSNAFSDTYGAWPTSFFLFEKQSGSAWRLTFRSRPTQEAHIDVGEVLDRLWTGIDDKE